MQEVNEELREVGGISTSGDIDIHDSVLLPVNNALAHTSPLCSVYPFYVPLKPKWFIILLVESLPTAWKNIA